MEHFISTHERRSQTEWINKNFSARESSTTVTYGLNWNNIICATFFMFFSSIASAIPSPNIVEFRDSTSTLSIEDYIIEISLSLKNLETQFKIQTSYSDQNVEKKKAAYYRSKKSITSYSQQLKNSKAKIEILERLVSQKQRYTLGKASLVSDWQPILKKMSQLPPDPQALYAPEIFLNLYTLCSAKPWTINFPSLVKSYLSSSEISNPIDPYVFLAAIKYEGANGLQLELDSSPLKNIKNNDFPIGTPLTSIRSEIDSQKKSQSKSQGSDDPNIETTETRQIDIGFNQNYGSEENQKSRNQKLKSISETYRKISPPVAQPEVNIPVSEGLRIELRTEKPLEAPRLDQVRRLKNN